MNANQTDRPNLRKDTAPDVIARLSIGAEACDDNIGSVCVANRGNGFGVFINGGMLPDGEDERFFPASDVHCLEQAYAFALSIVQQLVEEEVQIDGVTSREETGPLGPKYPDINVQLSGEDGNIFSIIGRVRRALRDGGASEVDLDAFGREVVDAGDYDSAIRTVMRWVETS
jgi:hypothetical protein